MEMSGNYHVEITNEYGSVTSEVTRLTVVNTLQEAWIMGIMRLIPARRIRGF